MFQVWNLIAAWMTFNSVGSSSCLCCSCREVVGVDDGCKKCRSLISQSGFHILNPACGSVRLRERLWFHINMSRLRVTVDFSSQYLTGISIFSWPYRTIKNIHRALVATSGYCGKKKKIHSLTFPRYVDNKWIQEPSGFSDHVWWESDV